ncbi:uncharacterized protein BDZ99DRAFT_462130 [Mytilinidion resinicola]|uniref:F-box domain-containing protein n=1 Tax=Mytilinidion resinicola TaxID=574789 RepID=A0A6A6YS74_9PEZI|nr:uncharacterized protein BDZ99DRAFT_462130 [Mytilinidion resinicola]KAF2810815.1 hypothetical protein BDZ99DRAFT_462130 [Mytilinidion resinicola]
MSLESLPTELYLQILRHAGVSDFPVQLSLLTISKRWFAIAHSIAFEHVKFVPRENGEFIRPETRAQENITTPPRIPPPILHDRTSKTILEILSTNLRSLELDLLDITFNATQFRGHHVPENGTTYEHTCCIPSISSYIALPALLRASPHLKALDIRVSVSRPAVVGIWSLPRVLQFPEFNALLSAPQRALTSLVIDVQYECYHYEKEPATCQTCLGIAAHLPTLRRLCVRMPWICPDVLSLSGSTATTTIPLRELVINLTTWAKMGRDGFLDSSRSCRAGDRHQVNHVRDMAAAVQRLRTCAPRLEVARLIKRESFREPMRNHRGFERMNVALDCLTGVEGLVDKKADWTREFGMEEMVFERRK